MTAESGTTGARGPRLLADLLCVVTSISVCLLAGKDLNADMLSYHISTAHSLWTGNFRSDFMSAGLQSFLNPLGYLPFYLMLKAGWHSMLVAAVMATLHATALMAVWRLSFDVLFRDQPFRLSLSALSTLLAGASPLFIATLGGSFLDPILSGLILFGVYLIARAAQLNGDLSAKPIFSAGLLLGIATGLKLTAVFFSIAVALAVLLSPGLAHRIRWTGLCLAGMAAGFFISGGFWAAHLLVEFGSPVFPIANGLFKAPDFPAISVGLDRFTAHTPWDGFTLPFRMTKVSSGIYAEIMVPDIRPAFLLLVLCGLVLRTLQSLSAARIDKQDFKRAGDGSTWFLGVFSALAYLFWVYSSGNGRYFLSVLLLTGPLSVWAAVSLIRIPKWTVLIVVLLLGLQLIHGGAAGYRRWDSTVWTPRWIDVEVPAKLSQSPHDFIMIGAGEDTFVSAYLHPESKHVLLGGKIPRSPRQPGGDRLAKFIKQGLAAGRLRMLIRETESRTSDLYRTSRADPATIELANADLAPWNLHASSTDCTYIGVDFAPLVAAHPTAAEIQQSAWPRNYSVLSCAVQIGTNLPTEFFKTLEALESVSKKLSKVCPQIFPAPSSLPVFLYDSWGFRYPGSDVIVIYKAGDLTYARFPFGPFAQPLGSLATWRDGEGTVDCKRLPRR